MWLAAEQNPIDGWGAAGFTTRMSTSVHLVKGSSSIEFSDPRRPYDDEYFVGLLAEVIDGGMRAKSRVLLARGLEQANLNEFLDEVAEGWKDGPKLSEFTSIEHDLAIRATRDAFGHVGLRFTLSDGYRENAWTASVTISVDAGNDMTTFAADMRRLCEVPFRPSA